MNLLYYIVYPRICAEFAIYSYYALLYLHSILKREILIA